MVLGATFFTEMERNYEKCYQHNPNASAAFLIRMKFLEESARRLGSDIEELLAESLAGQAPKQLNEHEQQLLDDYVKRNSIVKAFYPWIFAAYYLTDPGPDAHLKIKVD